MIRQADAGNWSNTRWGSPINEIEAYQLEIDAAPLTRIDGSHWLELQQHWDGLEMDVAGHEAYD